jgi:selenocysteine lyase/cysteine desulfurase
MENVAEQIAMLTRAFLCGAAELGIASKTSVDSVGPLVVLRARDPQAMVAKLAERGVLVSARLDGIRFSFHVYNNLDDVRAALAVLQENRALMVTE